MLATSAERFGTQPAVAGVRNLLTGKTHLATDEDAISTAPKRLHPLIRSRCNAEEALVHLHRRLRSGARDGQASSSVDLAGLADARLLELFDRWGISALCPFVELRQQFFRLNEYVLAIEDVVGAGMLDRSDWGLMLESNGKHAEVKAASDALYDADPAAHHGFEQFEIHTELFQDSSTLDGDEPRPRCVHCAFVTSGMLPTRELAQSEARYQASRWGWWTGPWR